MKRSLLTLFFFFNILVLQAQKNAPSTGRKPFKISQRPGSNSYVPGIIIVKFKAITSASSKTLSSRQPAYTLNSTSIVSLKQMFAESTAETKISSRRQEDKIGMGRIYEVKLSPSANIEVVINELLGNPQIEYAEPKYIHRMHVTLPNDPRYPEQTYLPQVKAPEAWDLARNLSPKVLIGIVDSGSELDHPDLAANIYYNTDDPENGKDDDGNGKVDDFRGWDFAGGSGDNEDNNPNVVSSANDHGVHVSGIASAVTDNGIGVASIAFNSAKLLIVKAGPDNNGEEIRRGFEGVKYAADMGANIINCSWGNNSGGNFGLDIIKYAQSKGCLIVAAVGNGGTDEPEYPAAYPGVLSVANVDINNSKASTSSFGHHVSISAPGGSILSTVFGKSYGRRSGTSMSSPVIASTAALAAAYRPGLTIQQVGELVRVTADNIDNQNSQYARQLGKGRVNVLRALTETPPSIRIQNITAEERIALTTRQLDTLNIYLDLKNLLYPVSNLNLSLSTLNTSLKVLNPTITIPLFGTLETKLRVGPFKVTVPSDVASNTSVEFLLTYAGSNNYQDYEWFNYTVAKDYIDIRTNSIATSITSIGRIGYSSPSEKNGLGFLYKGESLLYEAALMIGVSPERVSNNARAVADVTDEHFARTIKAHEVINNADSIVAESEFDDRRNPQRLNVGVKHRMTAYKVAPNDKYVIAEYEIFNLTNFQLKNLHVGMFTDWDILGGQTNVTQYDASSKLAYVYDKQAPGTYAGVKLLSQNAAPVYYPLSYQTSGNPLSDEDLTLAEKWETLSSGVKSSGLDVDNGIDVSFVSGYGPYTIPANRSIKVAFAFIGGDNLADLQNSAQLAQQKYNQLLKAQPEEIASTFKVEVYPNPVFASNGVHTIRFELPQDGKVTLDLYNLAGQRVRGLISGLDYGKGVHYLKYDFSGGFFSDVNSGLYFYRLKFNNEVKTNKISVLK